MARPSTCPPELARRVFRGTDAIARGLVTPDRLRSPIWTRFARDVYVHEEHRDETWARRDALRLITDSRHVACGLSAAWLHGVWQPRPGMPVPIQVSRPPATHGHAVEGHARRRLTLHPEGNGSSNRSDVDVVDGVTVTSALRTCFDLMRDRRLVEAVVVADAFLYLGVVDQVSLAVYCQERVRWPGVRGARRAGSLASPFARSPGESRLRAVLVLAGFEAPLVNVPVLDAAGRHVATPDLQVRGRRWAWLEYDGSSHESASQHESDVRRENRLAVAAGGTPVLRYDRRHVATTSGREDILGEITRATGSERRVDLRGADFLRPPADRAW
jgi:hypothetical protein